jgi:tRNA pseudouridine55 synthase
MDDPNCKEQQTLLVLYLLCHHRSHRYFHWLKLKAPAFSKDNSFDPIEGEMILIDKELDWTSFDVVKRIRNLIFHKLGVKKCKVGHAGTLDPLATGLLIVCIGRMTKKISGIQDGEKEYTGRFHFGQTTPSFDRETEVDAEWPWEHIRKENVQKEMNKFVGTIQQTPPIFSAKKIDGKRAYHAARAGKELIMRPQIIDIDKFEIVDFNPPEVAFKVVCSKGTYIRSLANDLGKALDSGAYLVELRRTRIGEYLVKDALTIDQFEHRIEQMAADAD